MSKKNINIIINLFAILIILCIQLFLICYYITTNSSIIIIILNLFLLFLYCFIYFNTILINKKFYKITQNLEEVQNHNAVLSDLYDNVKAFKHDFDNIIFTIGGFIDTNDINNLKNYYNSLLTDCRETNNIATLNPKIINNSGIYNLLIKKYNKANSLNVKLNLECFIDFNKINMSIYEFSRILGILIDNAIEAASSSIDKKVNIVFRDSSNNKTQLINIDNTYSNKNIDITKIFQKGVTEKKHHSGMGLWEVNKIINKNHNVKLLTSNDENYFKQHIEIYY